MRWFYKNIIHFLGIDQSKVNHNEKLIAGIGGFLGIFFISIITFQFVGAQGAAYIVPSMGASAVLLFAVPHGKLSQPWSLFGGHLSSALIGVACYQLIPNLFLAAGIAVGLSISIMHALKCIHPPGGATALAAVIGGPGIINLGYFYVLNPILINTIVIFIIAILFNRLFPWRQYPANAMQFIDKQIITNKEETNRLNKKYIEQAISDMNLLVDITTDDLQKLFELTLTHSEQRMSAKQIKLGHYYTNGKRNTEWSVRQIIDEAMSNDPDNGLVIFRIVEGTGANKSDSCTRKEFAQWASHELFPNQKQ